ncbi:hypothetical protein [Jeotgalibacillus sp. R-1-5s-1]|uniref:hypothetical protein n=1 Tax=Jeotgalibacillus sp. R-1-5s-1 TaxID=2555897 RepID=UPI0010699556|nr:hypothetical protein [Jeotgalibacillus sp. R-1-5s-1]TFD95845.1 hypothetical protein E2491_11750 [Jeotgalibacillus sp. R-1-5s-1]
MENKVYFSDRFFSAGKTDIFNSSKEQIGRLNLQSSFTSSVSVEDQEGNVLVEGSFPFFSNKWTIKQPGGRELGTVKYSLSFFTKRYTYMTPAAIYKIHSPAFSREYSILDQSDQVVAVFKKVNDFFSSPAFELRNHSATLLTDELIAVVMGVHAIEKRNNSSAASGGA